jgi:hypothetical protein
MRRHLQPNSRLLAAFALFVSLTTTAPAATPFGPNLMPNPGFEEATDPSLAPTGWTLVLDKPGAARLTTATHGAAAGKCSLSLEIGPPATRGQQLWLVSPTVTCPPGWYLASFWYRHEFTGQEQPHRRFDVERLRDTASGSRDDVVYQYYQERPAINAQWDHTFMLFRVRPGQEGVRFQFAYWNQNETRLQLDSFSLRKLDDATLSHAPLERTSILKGGLAADPIADPTASDGRAWRCEAGKHVAGNKVIWSAQGVLSPGLYRLRFRLRQEQPSQTGPVFLTAGGDNGAALDYVRAADFQGTTDYEDSDLFCFYPFGGGHCINWSFPGSGAYRFDHIRAEKVADLTMLESWGLLAAGIQPVAIQPTGIRPAGKPTVLLAGLTEYVMGLEPTLKTCGLDAERCDLQTIPGGITLGFTPALPALDGVRVLVMADVPARAFTPLEQLRVRQFVENGGKLIVFGGLYGYGHGGMKGSFLEEVLPVSVQRTFDRERVTGEFTEAESWFPAKLGDCAWLHAVTVKPRAQVCWRVGRRPAVVAGAFGNGWVIAITATMLGDPAQPFWESPVWRRELGGMLGAGNGSLKPRHKGNP